MAQHVELLNSGDWGSKKANRGVERAVSAIKKDFSKGLAYVRGSLRYTFEDWLTREYLKGGEKNSLVFSIKKKIHLDDSCSLDVYDLEIHYNVNSGKITHIYMVA